MGLTSEMIGRWLTCPNCNAQFAGSPDDANPEILLSDGDTGYVGSLSTIDDFGPNRSRSMWALALVFLGLGAVVATGVAVAIMTQDGKKVDPPRQFVARPIVTRSPNSGPRDDVSLQRGSGHAADTGRIAPPPSPKTKTEPETPPVVADLEPTTPSLPEAISPVPPPPQQRPPASPRSLPDGDEAPVDVPGTRLKRQPVPGYEIRAIDGFTMALSSEVINEAHKDQGKPFKALTDEFEGLTRALPPKALKVLQTKVLIWVEWNHTAPSGVHALAAYSNPNRATLGPVVEVFSLKNLTDVHAVYHPPLVLLHEMAHAVHQLFLVGGVSNPYVKAAYQQAMERHLYEDVPGPSGRNGRAYAATSEYEYFAELTCAYFDRCGYFPFTRDELKKHDAVGYQLMEKLWATNKNR